MRHARQYKHSFICSQRCSDSPADHPGRVGRGGAGEVRLERESYVKPPSVALTYLRCYDEWVLASIMLDSALKGVRPAGPPKLLQWPG